MTIQHAPKGAALLLNVFIIGTVAMLGAGILATSSVDSFLNKTDILNAWNTRADLFGCLDEALIHLQKDSAFAPNTTATGEVICATIITAPTTDTRSIVLSFTEGKNTRRLTALVTLSPFAVTQITEP